MKKRLYFGDFEKALGLRERSLRGETKAKREMELIAVNSGFENSDAMFAETIERFTELRHANNNIDPEMLSAIKAINRNPKFLEYIFLTYGVEHREKIIDIMNLIELQAAPIIVDRSMAEQSSQDNPSDFLTNEKKKSDEICLGWVNRPFIPRRNMTEYLNKIESETGMFITTEQFKDMLGEAGSRGVLEKVNRRWKEKTHS